MINYCIDNNLIKHKLFTGIIGHLAFIIQTEGLFEQYSVFSPEKYESFLIGIRDLVNNGKFKEIFRIE